MDGIGMTTRKWEVELSLEHDSMEGGDRIAPGAAIEQSSCRGLLNSWLEAIRSPSILPYLQLHYSWGLSVIEEPGVNYVFLVVL